MKAQTFKCLGGPLDGHDVTEQYAGQEYHRYNSSERVMGHVWDMAQQKWVKELKPKCVLVHESVWSK